MADATTINTPTVGTPVTSPNLEPTAPATVASTGNPTVTPTVDTITEAAHTRKFSSKGWEGLFKVSTRLLGEKEIDIDDREANMLFTLEMKTIEPWEFKIQNLHVVLKLVNADPNHNIAINGKTTGNLVIFDRKDSHELFPGAALNKQLKVTTGAFSTAKFNADSAEPGLKSYDIEIEYDIVPIMDETKNQTNTQLVFYIADD